MNPISSARTGEKSVWIRREGGRRSSYPFGIRVRIGPFQMVIGWLNRFAIWWKYRAIVDLYRRK